MTDIDLSTVPLSALTAEIKRRMTEFTEAQHMMSGFVPSDIVLYLTRCKSVIFYKCKVCSEVPTLQRPNRNPPYISGGVQRGFPHSGSLALDSGLQCLL